MTNNSKDKTSIEIAYLTDLATWSSDIMVALLTGKDPEIFKIKEFNELKEDFEGTKESYTKKQQHEFDEIIKEYDRVLSLIDSALKSRSLKNRQTSFSMYEHWTTYVSVKPIDFVNWVETKESISLPNGVVESVKRKSNIETLNYKEIQKELDQLKDENKSLTEQLTAKENQRVIATLYKIICGITKKHYKDKVSRISRLC